MTILWNNSRGEFEEIIQQYSLCLWWILGKRTWLWYKKELQNWEMISQPKLEITVEPVLRGSASRGHSCSRFSRSRNCHPLIILVSPTSLFYPFHLCRTVQLGRNHLIKLRIIFLVKTRTHALFAKSRARSARCCGLSRFVPS